jgi:hypothetical protein
VTRTPGPEEAKRNARKAARPDTTKEERTKPEEVAPPVPDPLMYAGVLGEMVRAAEPTTEADPVGIYTSLLAMAGAAIGPDAYVQIGNTRHALLFWPLLFGNTGSGRKGEATNTAAYFFRRSYPDWADITATGLSSGEGLIERIRDVMDEEDAGGTDDKRLLVIEPEFAQVMARAKREGSTLATVLRQAWECGPLSVLNRAQLKASGSHVAIVGHITPAEFRIRLAEADMAGGTYNRFAPFFVERSKRLPLPPGLDPDAVEPLTRKLAASIKAGRDAKQVTLDAGARKLWIAEVYEELTTYDDEEAVYTQFIQRAAPYCRRIAALLAVLDGRTAVISDDVGPALATVRYSIESARYVLGRTSQNRRLDKIRRAVGAVGAEGLTRSDISAQFSRNVGKAELDALIAELLAGDDFEEFSRRTGGRPAVAYRQRQAAEPGAAA